MIGTCLASLTCSSIFKAPTWVLIFFSVLSFIAFVAAIIAYFYCLFKGQTDALRSESFNLEKLAIERQISSDSLTGIQQPSNGQLRNVNPIDVPQDEEA
ncbi:hypothetical protein ACX1NX_09665 [Acinetobacter sp. ANC 5383]